MFCYRLPVKVYGGPPLLFLSDGEDEKKNRGGSAVVVRSHFDSWLNIIRDQNPKTERYVLWRIFVIFYFTTSTILPGFRTMTSFDRYRSNWCALS